MADEHIWHNAHEISDIALARRVPGIPWFRRPDTLFKVSHSHQRYVRIVR